MADMNLFQQFLFYFQENGGYVFAQFIQLLDFNLRGTFCLDRRDSNRDLDF